MIRHFMGCAILLTALPAFASSTYWVVSKQVDRRTCPSEQCGAVGFLLFRDKADVIDIKSGWARISKDNDAQCSDGRSGIIESGNDECSAKNGIVNGRFSEWVPVQQLSKTRPTGTAPK